MTCKHTEALALRIGGARNHLLALKLEQFAWQGFEMSDKLQVDRDKRQKTLSEANTLEEKAIELNRQARLVMEK